MTRSSFPTVSLAALGLALAFATPASAFQPGMARGGGASVHGGMAAHGGTVWNGPLRGARYNSGYDHSYGQRWARGRGYGWGWGTGWGGGSVVTVDRLPPAWTPPPLEPVVPQLPVGVRPSPIGAPVLYRIEVQGTHHPRSGAVVVSAGTPRPLGGTARGWSGGLTPQIVPLIAR